MSDENIEIESTASSSERHCDREFTLLLLSLYQEAPELWKVKSKHYFDKNKKALAITRITNALKVSDKNFTEEDLKKKINKLRTSFNRELKKKKESMKSGSSADEVYIPKLWYFNEMAFLLDSSEIAITQSSVDLQDSSEDTSDHHRAIQSKKHKKKKTDDVQVELLNLATSYFSNKEEDEYDVMSKVWAIQVRQLRADQEIFARKIINDVLFEGAMGTLTRQGVSFLPDVSSRSPVNISNKSSDSTYTSSIPPQSPVCRTYSPSNSPHFYPSSPQPSLSPIRYQSRERSKNVYAQLPVDVTQEPRYQLPNNNDDGSSSKSSEVTILTDERFLGTNTPNIDQSPTEKQSSTISPNLKKSSKSPHSKILSKSILERYTSSALNNESPKYVSSCQLSDDCFSTGEDYLIRPEDLNFTSKNRFSTTSEVEESNTAVEYQKNYLNF